MKTGEQSIVAAAAADHRASTYSSPYSPFPSLFLPHTHSLTHSPQGPTATLGIYVDSGSVYETAETTGKSSNSERERKEGGNCFFDGGGSPSLFFFSLSTLTLTEKNQIQKTRRVPPPRVPGLQGHAAPDALPAGARGEQFFFFPGLFFGGEVREKREKRERREREKSGKGFDD